MCRIYFFNKRRSRLTLQKGISAKLQYLILIKFLVFLVMYFANWTQKKFVNLPLFMSYTIFQGQFAEAFKGLWTNDA